MKKIIYVCFAILLSTTFMGCASDSYEEYALSDANEISTAIEGTIITSRVVRAQSKPGIATIGTAAIGGLAGSQIGVITSYSIHYTKLYEYLHNPDYRSVGSNQECIQCDDTFMWHNLKRVFTI